MTSNVEKKRRIADAEWAVGAGLSSRACQFASESLALASAATPAQAKDQPTRAVALRVAGRALPMVVELNSLSFLALADVACVFSCSTGCRTLAIAFLTTTPTIDFPCEEAEPLVMHCTKLQRLHVTGNPNCLAPLILQNSATLRVMRDWVSDDDVNCALSRCARLEHVEMQGDADELVLDRLRDSRSVTSLACSSSHSDALAAFGPTLRALMLRRVERNVRNLLKLTALSELEISCPLPEGPPLSDWLPLLRKYTGPFHVFLFSATDLRELTTPAVQAIEDAVIEGPRWPRLETLDLTHESKEGSSWPFLRGIPERWPQLRTLYLTLPHPENTLEGNVYQRAAVRLLLTRCALLRDFRVHIHEDGYAARLVTDVEFDDPLEAQTVCTAPNLERFVCGLDMHRFRLVAPKLRELSLGGEGELWATVFSDCPSLRHLTLVNEARFASDWDSVHRPAGVALAALPRLPLLSFMCDTNYGMQPAQVLRLVGQCPQLTRFLVVGKGLELYDLAQGGHPTLRELAAEGTNIPHHALDQLLCSTKLPSLVSLRIRDYGVKEVSSKWDWMRELAAERGIRLKLEPCPREFQ